MDYLHAVRIHLVSTLTGLPLEHDNHRRLQPPVAYTGPHILHEAS